MLNAPHEKKAQRSQDEHAQRVTDTKTPAWRFRRSGDGRQVRGPVGLAGDGRRGERFDLDIGQALGFDGRLRARNTAKGREAVLSQRIRLGGLARVRALSSDGATGAPERMLNESEGQSPRADVPISAIEARTRTRVVKDGMGPAPGPMGMPLR